MAQYEAPSERRSGRSARARPVTVTLAVILTLVGAVLAAVNGILLVSLASTVARDFRVNALGSGASLQEINNLSTAFQASMIISGIVILVLAIVVAILAFATARGNNAARITLVVLLAVSVCVGVGTGTFTSAARNATNIQTENIDAQTAANLGQALADSIPAWFAGFAVGLSCLEVLAVLAVIVLLLVPPSNAHFRRPAGAGETAAGPGGVTPQPPGPAEWAPPSGPGGYAAPGGPATPSPPAGPSMPPPPPPPPPTAPPPPPPTAEPPSTPPPSTPPPPDERPGGSTL